jgi:hypothetical protein
MAKMLLRAFEDPQKEGLSGLSQFSRQGVEYSSLLSTGMPFTVTPSKGVRNRLSFVDVNALTLTSGVRQQLGLSSCCFLRGGYSHSNNLSASGLTYQM